MGMMKIEIVEDRLTLVPADQAARDELGLHAGDKVEFDVSADGTLVLSSSGRSIEERLARGRAFLDRYRPTFEALAK
jgi:bifunctional DNA-binding transcriptional regulator/antitoxin component of YhaV-PrlF toxin-antitoxin module